MNPNYKEQEKKFSTGNYIAVLKKESEYRGIPVTSIKEVKKPKFTEDSVELHLIHKKDKHIFNIYSKLNDSIKLEYKDSNDLHVLNNVWKTLEDDFIGSYNESNLYRIKDLLSTDINLSKIGYEIKDKLEDQDISTSKNFPTIECWTMELHDGIYIFSESGRTRFASKNIKTLSEANELISMFVMAFEDGYKKGVDSTQKKIKETLGL